MSDPTVLQPRRRWLMLVVVIGLLCGVAGVGSHFFRSRQNLRSILAELDVVFRLWDVNKRRQPSLAIPKEKDE